MLFRMHFVGVQLASEFEFCFG